MPPSIAIATPVLGGPGTMRVVLNSSSTVPEVVRVVLNSSSSSSTVQLIHKRHSLRAGGFFR